MTRSVAPCHCKGWVVRLWYGGDPKSTAIAAARWLHGLYLAIKVAAGYWPPGRYFSAEATARAGRAWPGLGAGRPRQVRRPARQGPGLTLPAVRGSPLPAGRHSVLALCWRRRAPRPGQGSPLVVHRGQDAEAAVGDRGAVCWSQRCLFVCSLFGTAPRTPIIQPPLPMAGAASPTQHRGARASGFLSSQLSSRALHCLLRVVGFVCVCCMLRHRSYVASCVRRLCRVAHWLSRTMLRTCC